MTSTTHLLLVSCPRLPSTLPRLLLAIVPIGNVMQNETAMYIVIRAKNSILPRRIGNLTIDNL